MEENNYPGSSYQKIFNYLHEEHGLTLLESEMNDLINMVHKFHPAGAVLPADDAVQNWFEENIDKECSASSAVYKFRLWLESLQITRQTVAVWVKGAPKERKQYFAKVPSQIDDNLFHDAIIWPTQRAGHWYAAGNGFNFVVHDNEVIAYLDESGAPAAAREEDAVAIFEELWDEHAEYIDDDIDSLSRWAGSTVVDKEQFKTIVAKMWELFKQQKTKQ